MGGKSPLAESRGSNTLPGLASGLCDRLLAHVSGLVDDSGHAPRYQVRRRCAGTARVWMRGSTQLGILHNLSEFSQSFPSECLADFGEQGVFFLPNVVTDVLDQDRHLGGEPLVLGSHVFDL